MCNVFHLTEGKSFYEEKDEKESGVHEEENFDNRHFVNVEDNVCAKVRSRRNDGEEDNFTMDTASSSKTKEEENLENMERKLKKLEELFSSVPTVLIKRVLCRDDVKGDFNKAKQTLQEFQGMGNSQDFIKLPANYRPIARRAPDNFARSENKKGRIEMIESQNNQESRRKIGVTRKLKIENQNETQDRNGGEKNNVYLLRKNSFDINEPKLCENQVFPDRDAIQVGLACRCEARILGGGFDQGQGDNQKYSENVAHELGYGVPLNDHMFQSQRGRGNWRLGDNVVQPNRREMLTEELNMKTTFIKGIHFFKTMANRPSLKQDKEEINQDEDEEEVAQVITGHMNIQSIPQIR